MNDIIITIVTAIGSSGVTGFFTWFFARKKYNSEVDSQVITNMRESLDFYKTLSDDNKVRLDEVLTQNKEILKQNALLLSQNAELKQEVSELKQQVELLNQKNHGKVTPKKDSTKA